MATNFLKVRNGLSLTAQGVPSSPTNGDIYYNSTANTFVFYDNGNWINLASRVDVASATNLTSSTLTAAVVQNSLIRITGTTSTNLCGLTASSAGKQVIIYNETNTVVTIQYQSVTESTVANRITTSTLAPILLLSGQTAILFYDDSAATWVVASTSGTGGSGFGTGDDLDALQYQSDVTESFAFSPTSQSSSSTVDTTQSNSTYSATNSYMTMSYDASKTVTGTGTAMTISATPSYTVAVGDILRVGTQARKITVVTTQTSYTIEAAFTTNPSTSACTISQAVYSKDLNNTAFNGVAISAIYTGTISDCLVIYNDTSVGTIYNYTDPALVAYTASADNSAFTTVQAREANPSSTAGITGLSSTASNMYLRFFSNASSGSGTVNLVGYKVFFHRQTSTESGGILSQALCFTNSVGTPVGCSNPTINGSGVSQIVLSNSYPVGVNPGFANGGLIVTLNGQKIPRFISSTLTPDASYTEINATTIALDRNYSAQSYSVEIYQHTAVVDSNTQNTTNISILQTVPTVQKFLSGSGTYTLPTSPNKPRFIRVRMVGGGGGGGGTAGGGTAGGSTTFSTLTAGGGNPGNSPNAGSANTGGTATGGDINATGSAGAYGEYPATGVQGAGGVGASSVFGGGGFGGSPTVGGGAGSNGGGGGGTGSVSAGAGSSQGGGAGAYCEKIIGAPLSTYAYSVGTAGAGGPGTAGGAGGAGIIIVEEVY